MKPEEARQLLIDVAYTDLNKVECMRRPHQGRSDGKFATIHGASKTRRGNYLYIAWQNMRQRCSRSTHSEYRNYGGRGVKVCERWNDFTLFCKDVGSRPSDNHSLDRFPNKDGDYEPSNVRWAIPQEQSNNTRRNRIISFGGKTLSHVQWDRELGFKEGTIGDRKGKGWTDEEAILTPKGKSPKPRKTRWTSNKPEIF